MRVSAAALPAMALAHAPGSGPDGGPGGGPGGCPGGGPGAAVGVTGALVADPLPEAFAAVTVQVIWCAASASATV